MTQYITMMLHKMLYPNLMILSIFAYGAWTLGYMILIRQCFREKTYGVPMPALAANIWWEVIFALNLMTWQWPDLQDPVIVGKFTLSQGNLLWLVVDIILVVQLFMYGKQNQSNPFVKQYFYPLVIAVLLFSGIGLYHFCVYTYDVFGMLSGLMLAVYMGVQFIGLLFRRPDLRGLSYPFAWCKLVGNLAATLWTIGWLPAQFEAGAPAPGGIPGPPRWDLLLFFLVLIPILDSLYIFLLRRWRKALAAGHV